MRTSQIKGKKHVNQKLSQDEEEELLLQKDKKQRLAQKKFSKERFYQNKQERQLEEGKGDNDDGLKKVVSKRKQFENQIKEYKSLNFEDLLAQEGIDFMNPDLNISYLPLHYYDDCSMESIFVDDNIEFEKVFSDEEGNQIEATGEVLWRIDEAHEYKWFPAKIIGYNSDIQRFRCQLENEEIKLIPRIYICFDIENPHAFAKRLMAAFQRRLYADSLMRYKCYVASMPTDHLSELSLEQKMKLEKLVRQSKLENAEITALMMEVSQEYSQTMNQIIFDKYLSETQSDLIPHSLILPKEKAKSQIKYQGLLELNQGPEIIMNSPLDIVKLPGKEFTQIFKEFCLSSFLNTHEAINVLQQVKNECNKVRDLEFFNFNIPSNPYKLEEFQNEMENITHQTVQKLRAQWQPNIERYIKQNFENSEKSLCNLKVTDMAQYENGKLKRFLTFINLQMQDTILSLCQKSFKNYLDFISYFTPSKVEVISSARVINEFKNKSVQDSNDQDAQFRVDFIKPLFQLELLKNTEKEIFTFSQQPELVVDIVQMIFDKLLDDLSKLPNVERTLLHDMFRKNQSQFKETNIRVPQRDKFKEQTYVSRTKFDFDENEWVNQIFEKLSSETQLAVKPLKEYLEKFDQFKPILKLNPEEFVKQYDIEEKEGDQQKDENLQVEIIRDKMNQNSTEEQKLKAEFPENINISFFQIRAKETVNFLSNKFQKMNQLLIEIIGKKARNQSIKLFKQIKVIKDKILEKPVTIEKLVENLEYMNIVPNECNKIKQSIEKSMQIYDIMDQFQYKFPQEDIKKKWDVFGGPQEILDVIDNQKEQLQKEKLKFKEKMDQEQEEFKAEIEDIDRSIQGFNQYINLKDYQTVAGFAENINEKMKEFQERAKKFNNQESLQDKPSTDYSKIQTLIKDFNPYQVFWIITKNWFQYKQTWYHGRWESLDAEKCEKFIEDAVKSFSTITRFFKDKGLVQVNKICLEVKKEIDEFKPKVPLMVALRKSGMRERHWKQVSDIVGFEVYPNPDYTFTKILDMGLMKHVNECSEIGEKAYKEYMIETELNAMKLQWEEINITLKAYSKGTTNTFIMSGVEDVNNILDEHMLKTQAMQFSPFKKPFEQEISDWNESLKTMTEILEEWIKYQQKWMYLQPIFDSPDIAKQLPGEYKKFKGVDSNWKQTMNMTNQVKNCLKVCSTEGLLQKLKDGNENLDLIQKELEHYLERKRDRFARFYFLSNDELLEILSKTKDPSAVQPFLKTVFEAINKLDITAEKKFLAMFSAEEERVEFIKPIDPVNKNVEDWMGEVEDNMISSIRQAVYKAVLDYPRLRTKDKRKTRVDWVKCHPGQAILNGSQVHWTEECEDALTANCVKKYWEDALCVQLNDLVEAVRLPMTVQQKITLNALIVIDVHAKDVVETLWRNNIIDMTSFEWISQLRYYWTIIEDEVPKVEHLYVKQVQTVFPYGYEYLGNSLRLVITPLTDKCYMTLMGALKLNLGGAPAGPAGTGKTETTKDLAKALAKQCVVFNCSDTMDYLMVGKMFKGLASSGAWCCFDEFNRINIEVLSVIAQQLQILFDAKRDKKDRVENFEGSDIRLLPTFCVFITMNPGYAGRTELPDNLKALFRGVAMMVPDYGMIGEIMLYSFGFKQGRILAKKMVVTFKLSSEQLSSQDHYDYGMRAVRSVINAAGLLKTQEPDGEEDLLLLRALRDVNVPKFLKDDIPLFENIIKDLFPGVVRPEINYGSLLQSIEDNCKQQNIQKVDSFLTKVIQLYDTCQVRHGLMLVGPTGGGKTTNYKILQGALSDLDKNKKEFYKVQTWILNPKSIKMEQLYGGYNESTREWHDGILAITVRTSSRDQSGCRHWIVFDGPVDAIWIENMNTVLDDNKKLCLNSGEILKLSNYMTMMFEVEDLTVASPATVSRCGMVYMEPQAMGIAPLMKSWLNSIPDNCKTKSKTFQSTLQTLIDQFMEPCIQFLRGGQVKETVVTVDNNISQSLSRIMNCFFTEYVDTELKKITVEQITNLESQLESMFLYATIWSLCCTVDQQGREKFNAFMREHLKTINLKIRLPEEKSIYDYHWDKEKKQWIQWSEFYKNFEVDSRLNFNEIMIPTNDSTRNIQNMKLLLTNSNHVLFPGPTGTGKSLNVYDLLSNGMTEAFQYIALTFSAQTGENQTQDTIDSKIEKRRRGIYGPPVGKKCIIFVDDINMPKKEYYGAQPPLELLRQYLDHQGWYNRKDHSFMKIEDVMLLSAMGPPGGGRAVITPRLTRHFNIISYTELDDETIIYIFTTLLTSFLSRFQEEVKEMTDQLVASVLIIYKTVREQLLPTPKKSHYTFNLRDISKVFQGVCNASLKFCNEKVIIARLWYHENMRIFHDRLIDDDDRDQFKDILAQLLAKFNLQKEEVLNVERILFGDFQQGREVEPRNYYQVNDLKQLITQMEQFQEEYNQDPAFSGVTGKNQMRLVLFLDACEHICRIQRIIRQPNGHALLLGVGGSGRQSLSKMSTFIASYSLFQIEVVKGYSMRSWREDIKKVLMQAGVNQQPTTFLFVDTQIIKEDQVEDLNNVLNSGDVTGIYQDKDMEEIVTACKGECMRKNLQPNKMNIFAQYLIRVKANIHLVIAMSPLSNMFQTRLRMFPSLVNCCTLDWFTEWPEEALLGVGKGQLQEFCEQNNIENDSLGKLVECFKTMHKSVEKMSVRYRNELRRTNWVTPTSYLELLTMFKSVMNEKRVELKNAINRLKSGLNRLIDANIQVEKMQGELTALQPELEEASLQTEKVMAQIEIDTKSADETRKVVTEEETIASREMEKANKIKKEAEEQVGDAKKILDAAIAEVRKLKKEHLQEVKSLKNPPPASLDILGAMCYLLQDELANKGQKGIKMKNIEGSMGKKTEDYFSTAAILLNEPAALLEILVNYDKENINQQYINQLQQKIIPSPNFNLQKAENCSLAIKYIFLWAKAMFDFNRVFLETQPLREKLAEAQRTASEKMQLLSEKKAMLAEVESKLAKLEDLKRVNQQKKEDLEKQKESCQVKLERAIKLTQGLSGERVRWAEDIAKFEAKEELLQGNSVIGAGMVAYSGPFTSNFRQQLEDIWVAKLDEMEIKHEEGITMQGFLGVQITIQQWNLCGLPKDDTSIQNGIIIDKSRRWSLMIDPQTQANKYIKNMGKDNHAEGIDIVKMSDTSLMKILEIAIGAGKWVLVENVGKELDPSLDPILLQQVVKNSNGKQIQIGDKTLNYNDSFRFFMTTTNPNPVYSPETFVKVCIINFAITKSGLEDQMLALIVALENPALEQKKTEIVKRNAKDKADLLDIENKILNSLESNDDINELLKDETLINVLQNAKRFAAEINIRMKDSKITEIEIDKARESYRPVAYLASVLFFCIVDLNGIDPMYEYSLQWFMNLFKIGCENAPPAKEHHERLDNLNNYFTYSLYENICRSLFERHKLLFSFLLTVNILQGKGQMVEEEWKYLLTGPTGEIKVPPNPTKWIPDNQWADMYRQLYGMSQLQAFQGIDTQFIGDSESWKRIYDSLQPHSDELPAPWNTSLNQFQKLIVTKSIRPDKVIPGVSLWIASVMGQQFIIPPVFNLEKCFRDSSVLTPLIFVLSAGSDPKSDFVKFAESLDMSKRCDSISLGQGQGPKAEKMIKDYVQKGGWVLLQNCHLAVSWMPGLEKLVEEFNPELMNSDFRLWLSSQPSDKFPISVLQNGVKMTLEPPSGLRQNMKRSYVSAISDDYMNNCKQPTQFKQLIFGFCFFHAIIQDRRKFGPIGWNIPYDFTMEDLKCTLEQCKMLLNEYEIIPWKVLNMLGSEINYGGRVTDDKDVKLIKSILLTYMRPEILIEGHNFSKSGIYYSPTPDNQLSYLNYIDCLPLDPAPEVFGMHDNAEITNAQNQTLILLETILSVQPRTSSSSGKTREDTIEEIANFVQSKTPAVMDYEAIFIKYPTDYNESMNTVLCQEVIRYNKLLSAMKISLANVKKALRGLVVMSEDLEKIANSLYDNQVPMLWADKGFLSLKSLSSWTQDLNDRIDFLQKWIQNGTPDIYWISGFFFPQAFITGTLQNYARRNVIAIDQLAFDMIILDDKTPEQITEKPKEGCYIYGMFIEGARWDYQKHSIGESNPKELFSNLPMMHLQPVENRVEPTTGIYKCPLYKVVSRRGTLMTTGHSTNYVMIIELNSEQDENYWIVAGVAAFLSLRY